MIKKRKFEILFFSQEGCAYVKHKSTFRRIFSEILGAMYRVETSHNEKQEMALVFVWGDKRYRCWQVSFNFPVQKFFDKRNCKE
jgi:hypothetical protein